MAPTNQTPPPPADSLEQRLKQTLLEQRRAGYILVDTAERELRRMGWEPHRDRRTQRPRAIMGETKEGNRG